MRNTGATQADVVDPQSFPLELPKPLSCRDRDTELTAILKKTLVGLQSVDRVTPSVEQWLNDHVPRRTDTELALREHWRSEIMQWAKPSRRRPRPATPDESPVLFPETQPIASQPGDEDDEQYEPVGEMSESYVSPGESESMGSDGALSIPDDVSFIYE